MGQAVNKQAAVTIELDGMPQYRYLRIMMWVGGNVRSITFCLPKVALGHMEAFISAPPG